ncbi:MAG TPA: M28 family peptidase [Solirubrobacteraceae bacterium]|jgi:Zn-dependent M28 family amino/carboxypeptidase
MKRAIVVTTLLLAGCGGGGGDTPEKDPQPAPRGGDPAPHLEALQRIADRNDGVRAAGSDGDRETVDYIVKTLRAAGLRVTTQPVRFPYFERRAPARLGDLKPEKEVRLAEYSGSGRIRALVRRLPRGGCSAGDFAALRRGEIALVKRGPCFFRVKAANAQRAGAAAVVVSDTYGRTPVAATLIRPGVRIPVLIVTRAAGRRIAGGRVAVDVDATSEERTTTNVIAETKPAERWVMAGGHHDSVTAGPGLNDNGSGVAALLALAQRLRDRPGLRFGFWGAEELALYGSRRYVRSLGSAERDALEAYLNFDMLGSPNGRVYVYDRDDRIERTLRDAIRGREDEVSLEGASDHAPFERAGIPVGGIFTGASERGRRRGPADPCYHRRCDALDNVDRALLARMTDAAERGVLDLIRARR